MHKAQKTDRVKNLLKECGTTPIFVPADCTSIVQPLDVSTNAPFKRKVESAASQHMQDNLDGYLNGKITAGERHVLLSKWVGEAWEELSKNKDMIERSFKKCGISVATDGSEDFEIHLEGVENNRVTTNDALNDTEDPFEYVSDDSMEGDPFASPSDRGWLVITDI